MRKLPPSSTSRLLRWRSPQPIVHHWLASEETAASQPSSRRSLAQVRPEPLDEIWFTSSAPRRSPADDLLGSTATGPNGDHKPPDERTLKLGKSMYKRLPAIALTDSDSSSKTLSASTKYPHHSSTTRDRFTGNLSPPLPKHTSSSSYSQRSHLLSCCFMDCSCRLGLCTYRWQRQTPGTVRKDSSNWLRNNTTTR